jgi:quercetin dioxygenase-like cupin family protein
MSTTIPDPLEGIVDSAATGAVLVTREDADHYDLPERNIKEIVYSSKMGAKTFGFHIGELEANSRGGTHRHLCEAMIYIIEGRGHTILNHEQRIDWKAGDGIYVPPMAWHSHHTEDVPVRFLGMWNVPLMEAMGMYYVEESADTGRADARPTVHRTLDTQYLDAEPAA